MNLQDYLSADAKTLAAWIKTGEVSVAEALACAEQRLAEVNPDINAVVTDCFDFARQQLARLTGEEPYYGVPILVKDLGFSIQGIRDTSGSRLLADYHSPAHSDFIVALLKLGFLPIGKTNTAEFGLSYVTEPSLFGPCRSPLDLSRTAGGSSGGSAAAVAAGIVPVATASDGGGSIRVPAACCGLFGLKPSAGLMPTGPWVSESWSGFATAHVLTRSIADSADLFSHLSGQALTRRSPDTTRPLRIVQAPGLFADVPVDPLMRAAEDRARACLQHLGHEVTQSSSCLDLAAMGEQIYPIIAANTTASLTAQARAAGVIIESHLVEPVTWAFYQRGLAVSGAELIMAKNRLYQLLAPLRQLFTEYDLILSPALAQLPLKIGELSTQDEFETYLAKNLAFSPFTSIFNQAGLPAISLPIARHASLSLSIQLAANKGGEGLLVSVAEALQPFGLS